MIAIDIAQSGRFANLIRPGDGGSLLKGRAFEVIELVAHLELDVFNPDVGLGQRDAIPVIEILALDGEQGFGRNRVNVSYESAVDPKLGIGEGLVGGVDDLDSAITLVDQGGGAEIIGWLLSRVLALRREGGQLGFLRVITLERVLHLCAGAASSEDDASQCDCDCAKHERLLSK